MQSSVCQLGYNCSTANAARLPSMDPNVARCSTVGATAASVARRGRRRKTRGNQ
jgi:hypothetical protein